jgi:hypothetical protein
MFLGSFALLSATGCSMSPGRPTGLLGGPVHDSTSRWGQELAGGPRTARRGGPKMSECPRSAIYTAVAALTAAVRYKKTTVKSIKLNVSNRCQRFTARFVRYTARFLFLVPTASTTVKKNPAHHLGRDQLTNGCIDGVEQPNNGSKPNLIPKLYK